MLWEVTTKEGYTGRFGGSWEVTREYLRLVRENYRPTVVYLPQEAEMLIRFEGLTVRALHKQLQAYAKLYPPGVTEL